MGGAPGRMDTAALLSVAWWSLLEATVVQRYWVFTVAVVLAASSVGSGCGKDEGAAPAPEFRFPAAWAGVWRVTIPYQDCRTDSLLGVDVYVDSICAGGTLEGFLGVPEDRVDMNCTGTITDTDFSAHCTGRSQQFGIVLTITADFEASRDDSVFSGSGTALFRYQAGDNSDTDCYEMSFTADRQASVPPDCAASTTRALARPLARALLPRRSPPPRPQTARSP